MAGRSRKPPAAPPIGPREERYLSCKRCGLSHTLNLGPNEQRPTHQCSKLFKAMPFDIDLPGDKAPKKKAWHQEKPKHPRPH